MTVATLVGSEVSDRKRAAAIAELDRNNVPWREPVRGILFREVESVPAVECKRATPADAKRAKRNAAQREKAVADAATIRSAARAKAKEVVASARAKAKSQAKSLIDGARAEAAELRAKARAEFVSAPNAIEMAPGDVANVGPLSAEDKELVAALFKATDTDESWGDWRSGDARWELTPHELRKQNGRQRGQRVAIGCA